MSIEKQENELMVARDFKTRVLPISNKLLHFATMFLKNEELAQDVVQDVFLKLWQKRDALSKIENMEAFAVRMVRNRCLDVIRSNKTISIDGDAEKLVKGQSGDVHTKLELSETARKVKNLINDLPDIQRTVMMLRDIEQYSYDEIAETTGLKVNAIRVNLSRARKKVRDELLKSDDNGNTKYKTTAATIL